VVTGAKQHLRAEHPSLEQWLKESLTQAELRHIGLISLNQWPFMCAVIGEVALTAHNMGSDVSVGMWADDTPLPDPGWTTSRRAAHACFSHSIDENLEAAMIHAGLPDSSIVRPPIRRWKPRDLPPLPATVTRKDLRALSYHGSPMGRSILQVHPTLTTPIRDSYIWPRRYTRQAIRSYAWVYDQVAELIRQRDITTLVVYNGRFTHDQAAAAAAVAAGIKVLYYDAGGLETGFDLTFATTHDWDHLQRRMLRMWREWPDEDKEQIAETWFRNRQAHSEPGIEAFVEFQEIGNLDGVPEAELLVAFFSSSPDEIAELDLDWSRYHGSQPQALKALADAVRSTPGAELVVRTHPHMRLKPPLDHVDWQAAVQSAEPAAHFDADAPVDSYGLMRAADIVFTYGSTSGVEAAFLGKPAVVMGPSAYDLLGCVHYAQSQDEIQEHLHKPVSLPAQKALPYGLLMQRRGFNFTHAEQDSTGTFVMHGVPIKDASAWSRKLGDAAKKRKLSRLTKA